MQVYQLGNRRFWVLFLLGLLHIGCPDNVVDDTYVEEVVEKNGYVKGEDLADVAKSGEFNTIKNIPAGLSDGDDDTLANISCTLGQVPKKTDQGWSCSSIGALGILALRLELDEQEGVQSVTDSSGRDNHGEPMGALGFGAPGHTGQGVDFSGGYIVIPEGNNIPDSDQVWVEAWIRPDTTQGIHPILTKTGAYSIAQQENRIVFTIFGQRNPEQACQASAELPNPYSGGWVHVAGWYNGLDIVASVNGRQITAPCSQGPIVASAGASLYLGTDEQTAEGGNLFDGTIDEVKIRLIAPVKPPSNRDFFAYAQVDNMNNGADAETLLPIKVDYIKKYSDSLLKLTFSSCLRTHDASAAGFCCRWEIRINGANCSPAVSGIVYINPAGDYHQHRTISGICAGIPAGPLSIQPAVALCPSGKPGDCYTGWQSLTSLQVEEIY